MVGPVVGGSSATLTLRIMEGLPVIRAQSQTVTGQHQACSQLEVRTVRGHGLFVWT
jgi:hypothetical protein